MNTVFSQHNISMLFSILAHRHLKKCYQFANLIYKNTVYVYHRHTYKHYITYIQTHTLHVIYTYTHSYIQTHTLFSSYKVNAVHNSVHRLYIHLKFQTLFQLQLNSASLGNLQQNKSNLILFFFRKKSLKQASFLDRLHNTVQPRTITYN